MRFYATKVNGNFDLSDFQDEARGSVISLIKAVSAALRAAGDDDPVDFNALCHTLDMAADRLDDLIEFMLKNGGEEACKLSAKIDFLVQAAKKTCACQTGVTIEDAEKD